MVDWRLEDGGGKMSLEGKKNVFPVQEWFLVYWFLPDIHIIPTAWVPERQKKIKNILKNIYTLPSTEICALEEAKKSMQPKHFCTSVIKFHLKVVRNTHSGEQHKPKDSSVW